VIVIEDVYEGKGGEILTKLRDATLNLEFFRIESDSDYRS